MPFVGMVLGAITILLVTLQMASEPETPPARLLIVDYGLLALGVAGIVGSVVIYLRSRNGPPPRRR
jgi:uncharacterized membrane protein YedE/YeeE